MMLRRCVATGGLAFALTLGLAHAGALAQDSPATAPGAKAAGAARPASAATQPASAATQPSPAGTRPTAAATRPAAGGERKPQGAAPATGSSGNAHASQAEALQRAQQQRQEQMETFALSSLFMSLGSSNPEYGKLLAHQNRLNSQLQQLANTYRTLQDSDHAQPIRTVMESLVKELGQVDKKVHEAQTEYLQHLLERQKKEASGSDDTEALLSKFLPKEAIGKKGVATAPASNKTGD